MGENLELGAFLSCRAKAGEGELLYCPGYPYDTVMDALRGQSMLVKWALNTQSCHCHCHIGPCSK